MLANNDIVMTEMAKRHPQGIVEASAAIEKSQGITLA